MGGLAQVIQEGAFTQESKNIINDNFQLIGGNAFGAGAFGRIFTVNPETGDDNSGDGTPQAPFATMPAALANVVSGRGDTVVLQAGSYSANFTVDKDYVTIIGATVGGYARPDLEPATAGQPVMVVTGQGVVIAHLRFAANGGDGLQMRGNGFSISDCVFDGDLTADKAGLRLLPSDTDDSRTASEGKIFNNYFRGSAIGICFDTGAAPAVGVGSTDNKIFGNIFSRNTLDLATADSGGGVYSVQFTDIYNNQFVDKNKATYIDLTTTNGGAAGDQSGSINGNYFASDTITTTKIKMVGTAFTFTGNYYTVGIADGSGLD